MGKIESEPVYYFWNPVYNMLGVLPWLILIGAFLLLKENRCRHALWILLPLIIIYLVMVIVLKTTGMPSEAIQVLTSLFNSLVIGFAVIWLAAERIGRYHRFATWLSGLAIFACLIALSMLNLGIDTEMLFVIVLEALTAVILLIALPIGRALCGRRFGRIRFIIWTAIAITFFTLPAMLMFAAIQIGSVSEVVDYLGEILLAGLIFTGIIVGALLPFEILLLVNRFWRKRFETVFRIEARFKAVAEPSQQASVTE